MPPPITASILYDLVQCPRRVALDLFGDPAERDEISPFVKMLWERGSLYERDVIEGGDVPLLDLSHAEGAEKERLTLEAMRRGEPLIYGGRIAADELIVECRLRAKSIAPCVSMLNAVRAYSFAPSRAGRGAFIMVAQSASTAASSSPSGTTSLTSPASRARAALIIPVE